MSDLEKAWEELKSAALEFAYATERRGTTAEQKTLREIMLRGAARNFAEESDIANEEDDSGSEYA